RYIRQLIDRGDTLAQVKSALVVQYTSAVLALPPDRGFDVTVYLVPVVVVAALVALLAFLLTRWRRTPRTAPADGAGGSRQLSSADTARLEEDLRRYD
ncbi:MAG TPA: cytochrome c-type biogenesis protein CcmH, partial [Solirubrobacteraceae bacterium]|nr:cytochrome c-type biogenesis protein CcmH [Solirubrobacteraceae bacterium]